MPPGGKPRVRAGNRHAEVSDLAYLKIKDSKKEAEKAARREAEQARRREKAADFDLQQATLNIFKHAFSEVLSDSEELGRLLQEVKAALFAREFERAFGSESYLEAYASRWSPTRSLAYEGVLRDVAGHIKHLYVERSEEVVKDEVKGEEEGGADEPEKTEQETVEQTAEDAAQQVEKMTLTDSETAPSPKPTTTRHLPLLSIGGGAAELVAFASYLGRNQPSSLPPASGQITLLDSAPWSSVVDKLYTRLTTPPPLPKYASAAVKAANLPLIPPSRLASTFVQHDVLSLSKDKLTELVGEKPLLITMLFTLNELFTQAGIGATTKLLLEVTAVSPIGTVLLVVDSPGSYSETTVGKSSKKYPMQWLMDKVLSSVDGNRKWNKLESNESLWYRLSDGLEYPIQLENMRYQMHVYKLEKGDGA
jgi:25S rRNA (uracil2843-N3)-methyltransferase